MPRGRHVEPMLWVSTLAIQRFFEELHPDSLEPPHIFQGRGSPGLVLEHLSQECQSDRCDLALFGECGHGEIEEPIEKRVILFPEPIVSQPEFSQNSSAHG